MRDKGIAVQHDDVMYMHASTKLKPYHILSLTLHFYFLLPSLPLQFTAFNIPSFVKINTFPTKDLYYYYLFCCHATTQDLYMNTSSKKKNTESPFVFFFW